MKLGSSVGIKSCLLVLLGVFLLVVVGAFILSRTPPLVEFLSKSKQCFGTSVYLDGHFSFKVEHEYE
jgi:hypothetical protein